MTRRFVTAALASAQRLSGPSQPSRGAASLCVAVAFAVDHPRGQRVCPGDDASGPGTTVALSAAELAPRRRQKLRAPLEGRNAGGVWEAGRGPAHAPGRVGTRRRHPNGLAFAGSWGRLLPSRLDAPVAGPLAPAAHTPGAATCRSVARRRRPRLRRGGAGSSRPGGAARCPRTPRLAHEPRRWAFVPSPRGLRCLLPASRSRPGLGTIAGSEPDLSPCRARGRVRLGSRLPPATARGDPAPRPRPQPQRGETRCGARGSRRPLAPTYSKPSPADAHTRPF